MLKHAGASRARVHIARGTDRVSVEVTDDGRGAVRHGRRFGERTAWDAGAGHRARRHLLRRTGARRRLRRTRGAPPSESRHECVRVLLADDQELVRDGFAHDPGPAGRPRGGRLRGGRGGRRLGRALARAGRGADGRADAGDGRHRGDPADRRRVADAAPGAGAHHLRPRRVRLRRAPGRGQRVPPQGHSPRQPTGGGPGRWRPATCSSRRWSPAGWSSGSPGVRRPARRRRRGVG